VTIATATAVASSTRPSRRVGSRTTSAVPPTAHPSASQDHSCRRLIVGLDDGSRHAADFKLR